jgi:hypothetical protein
LLHQCPSVFKSEACYCTLLDQGICNIQTIGQVPIEELEESPMRGAARDVIPNASSKGNLVQVQSISQDRDHKGNILVGRQLRRRGWEIV